MIDKRKKSRALRLGLLCVRCEDNWVFDDGAFCIYCMLGEKGDRPDRRAEYLRKLEIEKQKRPRFKATTMGGATSTYALLGE